MNKEKITIKAESESQKPLGRKNFLAMTASGILIILGFLLMLGAPSGVDGEFNPDIFSTRRIVVGPCIAFIGFIAMAVSIILKPGIKK